MATTNQLGIPIAVGAIGDSIVKRDADGNLAANEITGNLFNVQYDSLSQAAITYDFSFIDADSTDYVKYGGIAVTNSSTALGAENGLMQFQAIRNGGIVNWAAYLASNNKIYLGFTNTIVSVEGLPGNGLLALNIDKEMVMASGTYGISISGNAATATLASTVTTNANLIGPITSVGNTTSVTNSAITNAMLAGSITASKLVQSDIVLAESQVTNLVTDLAAKLNLSGGTMLGNLVLNANPSSSLQAATKDYVDMLVAGFNNLTVTAASTANIAGTYNNGSSGVGATFTLTATGAFSLDGQAGVLNATYLLKDQSSSLQNGVYTLTTVGSVGVSAVLTRASNYDSPSEITPGDIINVALGTVNGGISYLETATVTTVGTDPITFTRWGGQSMTFVGDVSGSGFSPVTLTIGANKVVDGMLRQSTGLSLIGRSVNTTGDVADITAASDNQVLRRSGTSIAFGAINLASSNAVTGVLPNTNTTAATTNIINTLVQRDGSGNFSAGTITATSFSGPATSAANIIGGALGSMPYQTASSTTSLLAGNTSTTPQILTQVGNGSVSAAPTWTSSPTLTGLSISSTGAVFETIASTTTGSSNEGGLNLVRGDQANGYAQTHYKTGASDKWATGLRTGDDKFHVFDVTNSLDQYTITQGTSGNAVHAFLGRMTAASNGSTTDAGSMLGINSNGAGTAGNIYGIGVQKSGTDLAYLGVNKNTVTGSVPANAVFLSSYASGSKLSIGRGAGNGLMSTSDILLNGDGTISLGTGCAALAGTSAALAFDNIYGDGNYINFGTSGRNIGVFNGGVFFHTFNADYNATSNDYKYNTSNSATAIELGFTNIKLRAAPSGTAGNAITFQDVLTATLSGIAVTGDSNGVAIDATATASGILNQITVANPSNTANSGSLIKSSTAGASSGDAMYQVVNVGTGQTYSWGLDNSVANDPFVFSCSGSLGTTNAYSIDSSANMSINNNFASVGGYPAYQCRAWVNFNGTGTVAIRASGNVSSITDRGTGQYTVNLTNALVDANFSVSGMVQDTTNRAIVIDGGNTAASALTSSTAPIATVGASSSYTDMSVICVQIFR